MRDRITHFFPLGPTLAFEARIDCSAGAFRLIDETIAAAVAIEPGIISMISQLDNREVVAVESPTLTPDDVMIDAANFSRERGMAMRRIVLEARACMDDQLATEFGRLLAMPGAIFAYDSATPSVILVDRINLVLVVARGSA